jgi:protoporphyrinogen oxidase
MSKESYNIAIIGGGISGLVTAISLQKKGYQNITLFEKNTRLGGKLYTTWYKGKPYELGSLFGLPTQRHLKSFMDSLHMKADGHSLARIHYDVKGNKVMQISNEELKLFLKEFDRLPAILESYPSLKEVFIQKVEKPLTLPFSLWCDLHELKVLKQIYAQYFATFGLGDLSVIPALYVLRVLDYDTLLSLIEIPESFTWNCGVSSIVERIAQQMKDIRLGQEVTQITFLDKEKPCIHTAFETLTFDRVIITAPLHLFADSFKEDEELFSLLKSIQYGTYNVYTFITPKRPKGYGCVLPNLAKAHSGHMILWHNRWEEDEEGLLTIYAYKNLNHSSAQSFKIIEEDLLKLGIEDPKLYQSQSWEQCPYATTDMLQKGFYEKIQTAQGQKNVFFAGEIMSMLSMENCIRYAQHFVSKYF